MEPHGDCVDGHATELMLGRSILFRSFLISQPIRQRKNSTHERRVERLCRGLKGSSGPRPDMAMSAKACPASYVPNADQVPLISSSSRT